MRPSYPYIGSPYTGQMISLYWDKALSSWSCDFNWLITDAWHGRSGSTLLHVMSSILVALSHYLNQCWLIFNGVFVISSRNNFPEDITSWNYTITWTNVYFTSVRFCGIHSRAISQRVAQLFLCILNLKITLFMLSPHLPGATELNNSPSVYVLDRHLECFN